jgi:hypothetical protein
MAREGSSNGSCRPTRVDLVSSRGVMEVQKVPLIECLTHSSGHFGQVRVIGLNVGGDGRAIINYPYGGGACERSIDLIPHI